MNTRMLPARVYPCELACAVALLAWGMVLLNPWHDTFADSTVYDALAAAAPETAWGALFAGIGAVQIAGILYAARDWHRARSVAQAATVASFAFLAAMFAIGNPWSAGPWLHATFAWLAYRGWVDAA